MKCWVFVLSAVFFSIPAFSQNSYQERYMNAAGSAAILFSGEAAPHYPYRYTNTPYAYGEVFESGVVVFRTMKYDGILMNLDISAGCLCIRASMTSKPVALERGEVSRFSYGGNSFINIDVSPFSSAPGTVDGYAEVLGESPDMILVKKSRKTVDEDKSSGVVVRSFVESSEFWLLRRDAAWRITKPGTYCKAFPERKQRIKSAWRSIPDKLREDKAYSYTELFKIVCAE